MPKGLGCVGTWVWGRPCLSAGLEVKPWQVGPPCCGIPSFPPGGNGSTPWRGGTELALLCTWREPSEQAAQGRRARLAAAKLNIYVLATKSQRGVTVGPGCVTGERSCLAMPEKGRRGWCGGHGEAAQTIPRGWRGTMAGGRAMHSWWDILRLPLCLFHLPAVLQGAGDQTSLPAAWTLGFVSSHLPGFFPCTRLSYLFLCACDCFEAHLQLVWQHPSPSVLSVTGSLGDLASLSPDRALSALPRVLPGCGGMDGAQPSPLQRCGCSYGCFC